MGTLIKPRIKPALDSQAQPAYTGGMAIEALPDSGTEPTSKPEIIPTANYLSERFSDLGERMLLFASGIHSEQRGTSQTLDMVKVPDELDSLDEMSSEFQELKMLVETHAGTRKENRRSIVANGNVIYLPHQPEAE